MKFDFSREKLKRMVLDYPFLKPFDKEINNDLIIEIELEIERINIIISNLKKDKSSYESKNLKQSVKDEISKLNRDKKVLQDYLTHVKKIVSYVKPEPLKEKGDTNLLNDRQKAILNDILNEKIIKLSVKDLTDIYIYLLDNLDLEKLKKVAIYLSCLYNKANDEVKEDLIVLINKLRTKTHNKQKECNKKDDKIASNKLNDIINFLTVEYIEIETKDYRFEVLDFWLKDENSYIYIKRLTEVMPEIINIKVDGKNVIFKILDYYFRSCLTELKNRTKYYVKKDYYLQIINLFINHPCFDKSLIPLINYKLDSFKETIQRYKLSNDILMHMQQIGKKETYDTPSMPKLDNDIIKYVFDYQTHNKQRYNLTEETFAFKNENNPYISKCYSTFVNDRGNIVIRVHTIDISEYMKNNDEYLEYLKSKVSGKDLFDDEFKKQVSFSLGRSRLSFTYELEMLPNGKVLDFNIYKSFIRLDKIYDYKDFGFPNDIVKFSYYLLNGSKEIPNNLGVELEKLYLSRVGNVVGRYFEKNKYPFVYRVQEEKTSEDFVRNMSQLSHIMGKMDKKDAKTIFGIICEDHNNSYYTNKNIGHYSSSQKYYLDLFNPLENYMTLLLQKLIYEYFMYKGKFKDETLQDEVLKAIENANELKEKVKTI